MFLYFLNLFDKCLHIELLQVTDLITHLFFLDCIITALFFTTTLKEILFISCDYNINGGRANGVILYGLGALCNWAMGLISKNTKIYLKMCCQFYQSDLYCDITVCLTVISDSQLRSILALCEFEPCLQILNCPYY